jgi:integrase
MRRTAERSKGTVRFALKDSVSVLGSDPKRESLLMMHFAYGTFRFKYSTGYKIAFENWNQDKQEVRNRATIIDRGNINDFLSDLKNELYKELSRLNAEQLPITKEALKERLDTFSNRKVIKADSSRPATFFDYAEAFTKNKEGQISVFTIRAYNQTIQRLRDYAQEHPGGIDFHSFDMAFFYGFKAHLEEEDYSQNTIHKHFKNLKVILNHAMIEGYQVNPIYKSRAFNVKPEETMSIYLTTDEIERLENYNLSGFPDLERARDIFLIGLSTGQRVSDYNRLTKDNIVSINGNRFFKIKQKKTGKVVECLITPKIQIMMDERYDGIPPKKMPDQHLNKHLKVIGKKAKITEQVIVTSTIGGKKVTTTIPKHDLITTHTARRSFCTNKYKDGKTVQDIMHFSGHSGEREFYKYIRITGEERSSHLVQTGFFN